MSAPNGLLLNLFVLVTDGAAVRSCGVMMEAAMRIEAVMALVGLVALAAPALAATEPVKGLYREDQYVSAASTSPSGLSGCDTVGETLGGQFDFNGAGKTGSTSYGTYETSSSNYIGICKFPVAPQAGVTTWSGTYPCTNYPFSGSDTKYTTTFSWTITYVDANSFLAEKVLTFPVPGGTCTTHRNAAFVRSGK
jgi:hypothetical protein